MRLILGACGVLAATTALAGEALIAAPAPPVAAAAPPARVDAMPTTPAKGFPAIYTAPLFGQKGTPGLGRVDETALHFYAQEKNTVRVDAEIRRLKLLYPAWKPPANPYAVGGTGVGEQPLWDLFASGRLAVLRDAIKQRQTRDPGWQPSFELNDKLNRQEGYSALAAAGKAGNWNTVLETADRTPGILGCASVDAAWWVAEAFARTGAPQRSFEIDQAVLITCRDREARIATVRKAVPLLPPEAVDKLVALGDAMPDGTGEFDAIALDLVRQRIGAALAAGGDTPVPDLNLALLRQAAARPGHSQDAGLLGWLSLRQKSFSEAETWFRAAIAGAPADAKLAEGLALTLRDLDRRDDALVLVTAWRERSPGLRSLYVAWFVERLGGPKPASPADVAAFSAMILAEKNLEGAQALGWMRFNAKDWPGAVDWFHRAYDWSAGTSAEAPAMAKIVEGYALALKATGQARAAQNVVFASAERSPALGALVADFAADALAAGGPDLDAARAGQIEAAVAATRSPRGAAALGWWDSRRKRPTEATVWFKVALDWRAPETSPDAKVLEGYILALRAAGRPDEAVAVAKTWRDRIPSMQALLRDALMDSLGQKASGLTDTDIADAVRLVAMDTAPQSAATLGWHEFNTGDMTQAETWFKTAVARGNGANPDPKTVEGLALALRGEGRLRDALVFATAWSERLPTLDATVLSLAVDLLPATAAADPLAPDLLARLDDVAAAQRAIAFASARAWYAFSRENWVEAEEWFGRVIEWSPAHAGDIKTAEGYGATLHHLCRFDEAESVLLPWIDRPEGDLVRAVFIDTLAEQLATLSARKVLVQDVMNRFAAAVSTAASANGAQALGWYSYRVGQPQAAQAWFAKAMALQPTEPTAFGLALALRRSTDRAALGRYLDATVPRFPILAAFLRLAPQDPDPPLPPSLLDRSGTGCAATPSRLAQIAQPASRPQPPGNLRQAGETTPAGIAPTIRPVLTADTGSDLGTVPRRKAAAARPTVASGDAIAALRRKDYGRCAEILQPKASAGMLSAGDRRILGWCLLGLERPSEAAQSFQRASGQGDAADRSDSAYGEALALLRTGDTADAARVAGAAPLNVEQRRALAAQSLQGQAEAAFRAENWTATISKLDQRRASAPESRDQLTLRGWAAYHLGRYAEAKSAFTTIDSLLSDAESRRALAIVDDAERPKGR